jgi:hypothetical protein
MSSIMAMKILTAALFVCLTGLSAHEADAQGLVGVHGYYRGNGTYVQPHVRPYPDGTTLNNLGSWR